MKLPFLSKAWPSCSNQPRTLSFRHNSNNIFNTINSAFVVDGLDTTTTITTHDYSMLSKNSSESARFSTLMSEDSGGACSSVETVIQGLRSERLFFEPGETNSILEESKPGGFPFKESSVELMESQDPYSDFRKSMEEIVEAYGVKDWEGLEKLLCWYLRANGKSDHDYIAGAFIYLLVSLSAHDLSTDNVNVVSSSPSSPLSFCPSSCGDDDDDDSSSLTPCISSMEAESSENREKDD